MGKGGVPLELHVLFLGVAVGGENVKKWCDNQEKKFFRDNVVQVLIPFQEGYRGLLKFYVNFEEGVSLCEKGKNFF